MDVCCGGMCHDVHTYMYEMMVWVFAGTVWMYGVMCLDAHKCVYVMMVVRML